MNDKDLEYFNMFNELEKRNGISKITYEKKHGIAHFKIYTRRNKETGKANKYRFATNNRETEIKFFELYRRCKINNKHNIHLKEINEKVATVVAGFIIVGSIGGVVYKTTSNANKYLELNEEATKIVNQINEENPGVKSPELQKNVYEQLYNEEREKYIADMKKKALEKQQNYEDKKEEYEEENKEKILSTGEDLDSYMERTFEGRYDDPVYQEYIEYKNKTTEQEKNAKSK